jgi:hypothetical protein
VISFCKGMPSEFLEFIKYIKKLKYGEKPDYKYLCSLFNKSYLKLKKKEEQDKKNGQRQIETETEHL